MKAKPITRYFILIVVDRVRIGKLRFPSQKNEESKNFNFK